MCPTYCKYAQVSGGEDVILPGSRMVASRAGARASLFALGFYFPAHAHTFFVVDLSQNRQRTKVSRSESPHARLRMLSLRLYLDR